MKRLPIRTSRFHCTAPARALMVCLLASVLPMQTGSAYQQFETTFLGFRAGSNPRGLAVGDIDGDGLADMVVSNYFGNSVNCFRNTGGAHMNRYQDLITGAGPRGVALADVTQDGVTDLLVCCSDANLLRVNPGLGSGSVSFPTGLFPQAVTVADMNNDMIPDVVVAEGNSNQVSVFLGLGGGSFATPASCPTGAFPQDLVVADFNSDGWQDVAVACLLSPPMISVLLGVGSGNLGGRVDYLNYADAITGGDFDRDGDIDLASLDNTINSSRIRIYANNGTGSFSNEVTVPTANNLTDIGVADFNSDGDLDLVGCSTSGNPTPSAALVFHFGSAGCTFGPPQSLDACADAQVLATADVTGEGLPDVVTAGGSTAAAYVNRGGGDFGPDFVIDVAGNAYGLALGNLNADGILDCVVVSSGAAATLLYGLGTGYFAPGVQTAGITNARDVEIVDVNGDLKNDLVAATNANTAVVALADGLGGYIPQPGLGTAAGAEALVVRDLNRDGLLDIAVACRNANKVTVFLGIGIGAFGPRVDYSTSSGPMCIDTGDFNEDGYVDIVTGNVGGFGSASVLWGTAAGTFSVRTNFSTGWECRDVEVGDVNHDDNLDLVCAKFPGGSVLLGNGSGGFSPPTSYGDFYGYGVSLSDFDLDGHLDFVVVDNLTHHAGYFRGDGAGGFEHQANYGVGKAPQAAESGDLDNDGWPDLVVGGLGGPYASVLRNRGLATSGVGGDDAPGPKEARLWLSPAAPNPFWGSTQLWLSVPEAQPTEVWVADVSGRLVRRLNSGVVARQSFSVQWDGRTEGGVLAASGAYWVVARNPLGRVSRRLTLVR